MIRRAVHRRGLAVIALFASLGAAVWVLQPPAPELGPGSTWGVDRFEYRQGETEEIRASIRNDGGSGVTVQRVLPGDKTFDGMLRITGSTLRPTRLEPDEEVELTLRATFESCRGFSAGSSATLMQFRVLVDDGDTEWVRLGRPVRVEAPETCPGR